MPRGWLVVNSFLNSTKFRSIYSHLTESARRGGVLLETIRGCDISYPFGFDRPLPDFVLFWDKDIHLAKYLQGLGLRLFNSASAVEICDDKALTAVCLSRCGIKTPDTLVAPKTFDKVGYTDLSFLERAGQLLGYPMVIKQTCGSFGEQVYLAHSPEEAEGIVMRAGSSELIMQRFVASGAGRDVRVNVVGGKVVASMLRYSVNGDFRSNITNGGCMKRWEPDEAQRAAALSACDAVGLDFAGVDVLFGEGGEPLICELNSNPHFVSTLSCTGVDMGELIIEHITKRLKE